MHAPAQGIDLRQCRCTESAPGPDLASVRCRTQERCKVQHKSASRLQARVPSPEQIEKCTSLGSVIPPSTGRWEGLDGVGCGNAQTTLLLEHNLGG